MEVTSLSQSSKAWYRAINEFDATRPTLVWFSHAGGGTSPFIRACREITLDVNLFVALMPGRENRFNDPLPVTLDGLVDDLANQLPPTSSPPILIGHSFGAVLAYGVARRLLLGERTEARQVAGLVVMAMSAPSVLKNQEHIAHLDDSEFIEKLDRKFGGIPKALKDNEDAMALFLPAVRNELKLLESYVDQPEEPIGIPVIALAGADDAAASQWRMKDWALKTTGDFQSRTIPGDHFFPIARFTEIIETAKQLLPPLRG